MARIAEVKNTQFTTPDSGRGLSLRLDKTGAVSGEAEFTIASINTNVLIGLQYSDDNFETIKDVETLQPTANGKYTLRVRVGNAKAVRPVFSTESGGTAAVIDVTTRLFN